MELNHLHLHVRDLERSRRFYEQYFAMRERVRDGELLFLASPAGFDLALMRDPAPARLPPWFHFGFRLDSAAAVELVHGRMAAAGVPVPRALVRDVDLVSFRCADPDGYAIEVYWEPVSG